MYYNSSTRIPTRNFAIVYVYVYRHLSVTPILFLLPMNKKQTGRFRDKPEPTINIMHTYYCKRNNYYEYSKNESLTNNDVLKYIVLHAQHSFHTPNTPKNLKMILFFVF